jgi:hypothetical protein
MAKDPWRDPDPQPGDFDTYLESIDPRDPRYVQIHQGNPAAKVRFIVSVEGEDATRLEQLALERGKDIDEVVADLVRNAA